MSPIIEKTFDFPNLFSEKGSSITQRIVGVIPELFGLFGINTIISRTEESRKKEEIVAYFLLEYK